VIDTATGTDALAANKALARRWLELVSAHDLDAMLRLTAPDWSMEGGPPDLPTGHEGVYALFEHIGPVRQTWTVQDVIAEGDKVVVRALNHCVQESFFGIPAAGIEQVFTATFIFQVLDGLIVRTWRNAADLQRLFQLGARVLPPE
jgi:ketosteroid isomerase-like protein